jgi:predicted RNase H-like HicB family nuclease
MKFIIAIEPATDESCFGVVVPDLPGCFSAGDTLDEAIQNAHEAIDLHCETFIEDGLDIPPGKSIAVHQADPDFAGWIWAVVDVPVEKYLGPAEKINITVPRLLLSRIDEYARSHGATRSGFLAQAARQAMAVEIRG